MRYQTSEIRMSEADRASWENQRLAEMTSGRTRPVCREIGQHQKWPRADADGLPCLAAAPTFAIMALVAILQDGGVPGMLCSAAHSALPLTGMVPMYLLMSAFHSAPWLRLIAKLANRRPASLIGIW
jgi:hypothetical protein